MNGMQITGLMAGLETIQNVMDPEILSVDINKLDEKPLVHLTLTGYEQAKAALPTTKSFITNHTQGMLKIYMETERAIFFTLINAEYAKED